MVQPESITTRERLHGDSPLKTDWAVCSPVRPFMRLEGMAMRKKCTKCGKMKDIKAFSICRAAKDGRQSRCKECQAAYFAGNRKARMAYQRRYRAAHREAVLAWSRKYEATHRATRRAHTRQYDATHREARRAYARKRYRTNRERMIASAVNWHELHPKQRRARNAVNHAKDRGDLVLQPCEICGSTENVHGHHPDYSKPLEVCWLCASCHQRLHAKKRREREAKI